MFPRDIAQIQSLKAERLRIDHYEPGEIVIAKHEVGRELYIVRSGEVDVFQPAENGAAEVPVATLGVGEVFGEKALLDDAPRGASVRARTAVEVLVISRDDFTAMVTQFPVLDEYFDRLMKARYPEHVPATATLAERIALPVPQPGRGRSN
jgi:NADH dehydrogenase